MLGNVKGVAAIFPLKGIYCRKTLPIENLVLKLVPTRKDVRLHLSAEFTGNNFMSQFCGFHKLPGQ